jgi:hypothetical protein
MMNLNHLLRTDNIQTKYKQVFVIRELQVHYISLPRHLPHTPRSIKTSSEAHKPHSSPTKTHLENWLHQSTNVQAMPQTCANKSLAIAKQERISCWLCRYSDKATRWTMGRMVLGSHSSTVKWMRRVADHLPPPIAEVKNGWSYTSTPDAFRACKGTT